jgi:uncharacterized protein (DUF2147 family)
VLNGRIEKLLRKDAKPDAVCDECTDDRKGKPWSASRSSAAQRRPRASEVWEDGKILDPENGKTYALRLTPIDGGKKLEVRGSVFGIGRTQTWVRVQ